MSGPDRRRFALPPSKAQRLRQSETGLTLFTTQEDQLAALKADGLAGYSKLLKPRAPQEHFNGDRHQRLVNDGYTGAPAATERQVLLAVWHLLRLHPKVAFVGRFNAGAAVDARGQFVRFCSLPGFPDLAGMLKGGRALYVEIKRPAPNAGKLTELQAAFLERARHFGALAFVARSVEDAQRELDAV